MIGTPAAYRAAVPDRVRTRAMRLPVVQDRDVPPVFWQRDGLPYALSAQRGRAPMIFVVAGTGASYRAEKVRFLREVLHGAGFHVVALSSPTHPDFITTASRSSMPGLLPADVEDLYDVMKRVHEQVRGDLDISAFYVTGYSLGGTQAAFLGHLDERQGYFNFDRIFMMCPAVSLYSSVEILDEMFAQALPEGGESVNELVTRLLRLVTEYVHSAGRGPLDSELLYHIADSQRPSDEDLAGAIATVFRIAAANLIFSADVMTGGGHVMEAGTVLRTSTSLTQFFKRSVRWTFVRYMDEMLLPYWRERGRVADRNALIGQAGLGSIRSYLQRADHIGLGANVDDFILADGEVEFLRETFGPRATIYPRGGHCGNLQYKQNVEDMLGFLRPVSRGPE